MDPTTKPETGESAAAAGALVRVAEAPLPPVLARAGPRARFAADEFFAAQLRNPHTRRAYRRWIGRFIAACDAAGVELAAVTPGFAGRWIDELPVGPLSKNQALTALRRFCDGLVMRHVIALNPFLSVRFQKYQAVEGRTPEITRGQIQQLLRSIDTTTIRGLRDRAVLGTLTYTGARVGALARLQLQDRRMTEAGAVMRFHEKGGKDREIPIRSTLDAWLTAYLKAGGLLEAPKATPLFRALDVLDWRRLTAQPLSDHRIRDVLKTRLKAAGLPSEFRPHSFRVFVVTDLLLQHVPLEDVQHLAGHATPKTTQIYDRRGRTVTRNIVERISA